MKRGTGIRVKGNTGFTLMELVMVIMLVGILAVVAVPNLIDFGSDARTAVTRDEMLTIKRAILGDSRVAVKGAIVFAGYEADMGALPSKLEDLVKNPGTGDTTQDYNPLKRSGWRGPYVDNSTVSDYSSDAWDTAYVYSSASRLIRSWGEDGADDTGGDDDIDLTF